MPWLFQLDRLGLVGAPNSGRHWTDKPAPAVAAPVPSIFGHSVHGWFDCKHVRHGPGVKMNRKSLHSGGYLSGDSEGWPADLPPEGGD